MELYPVDTFRVYSLNQDEAVNDLKILLTYCNEKWHRQQKLGETNASIHKHTGFPLFSSYKIPWLCPGIYLIFPWLLLNIYIAFIQYLFFYVWHSNLLLGNYTKSLHALKYSSIDNTQK